MSCSFNSPLSLCYKDSENDDKVDDQNYPESGSDLQHEEEVPRSNDNEPTKKKQIQKPKWSLETGLFVMK